MTDSTFTNREKRFEVNELIGFDVLVQRCEFGEDVFYASLIDFSQRGGKFEVPFCPRFDEMLNVAFKFKDSTLSYFGAARVRHMRNVGENRWQIGCQLDPSLPQEVVSYLAKRTNSERRQSLRIEMVGEGMLRRQATPHGSPASIRNLSKGGFCLLTDQEHNIGELVTFELTPNGETDAEESTSDTQQRLSIGCRIRWQRESAGGFVIGCSFVDASAFTKLSEQLAVHQKPAKSDVKPLTLVAAIATVLLMLAIFANQRLQDRVVVVDNAAKIISPSTPPPIGSAQSEPRDHTEPEGVYNAVQDPVQQLTDDDAIEEHSPSQDKSSDIAVDADASNPQPQLELERQRIVVPAPAAPPVAAADVDQHEFMAAENDEKISSRRVGRFVNPSKAESRLPNADVTASRKPGEIPAVLQHFVPPKTIDQPLPGSSRRIKPRLAVFVESEVINQTVATSEQHGLQLDWQIEKPEKKRAENTIRNPADELRQWAAQQDR